MRKNILLVIFMVATLVLGGFVIYDKVLKNNNASTKCTVNENENIDELIKYFEGYDKLGIEIILENNYLRYLPYSDKSYNVSSLSDRDISMSVWEYILRTSGGWTTDTLSRSKDEIDSFLEDLYGLKNYQVKEMKIDNNNIFGLQVGSNKYTISVTPTEFGMTGYHVYDIEFDTDKKEVNVYFERYMEGVYTVKTGEGIAKFKIIQDENTAWTSYHFEFVSMDIK